MIQPHAGTWPASRHPVKLKAWQEKTVTSKPEDFKLNGDSPVK